MLFLLSQKSLNRAGLKLTRGQPSPASQMLRFKGVHHYTWSRNTLKFVFLLITWFKREGLKATLGAGSYVSPNQAQPPAAHCLTSLSHHRRVSETRSVVPQNAPHSGWICFLSGIMFLSHLNFLKLEVNSGSLITFRFSLFKYDVCVPSYQDRKSSLLNIRNKCSWVLSSCWLPASQRWMNS